MGVFGSEQEHLCTTVGDLGHFALLAKVCLLHFDLWLATPQPVAFCGNCRVVADFQEVHACVLGDTRLLTCVGPVLPTYNTVWFLVCWT